MRLLIVDDEPAARPEFAVLGEAACGRVAICAALPPDLILLEMELPDTTGLELLRVARRTAVSLGMERGARASGLARLLASIERAGARPSRTAPAAAAAPGRRARAPPVRAQARA